MQFDDLYTELHDLTDELLGSNQLVKLKAGGYSMFPFFKNGEIITVKKCRADELRIGNIVVFKVDNKWVTHRLLKIILQNNKTYFIAKGDSCKKKDPMFTEENLIGKVVSHLHNDKHKNLESNYYKKTWRNTT